MLDEDKIIGFGDFTKDGELSGVYIHQKFTGRGVGKLIVEKMEKVALSMGIKKFQLIPTITARTARNFYKHLGYRW